jgi:molecular chaperone DnaJ
MRRPPDSSASGAPRHDPYQLLGVGPDATVEEINTAYRRALRRQHPDTRTQPVATPREPSMADLQAARADLLRRARARSTPDRAAPPPPPPEPPVRSPAETSTTTHLDPPIGARGRWPFRVDEPDLVVGPVRYHGPARR